MRIIITTGPTREYIDRVRFISNASSGRMGRAVAQAALEEGDDVLLLAGESVYQRVADLACERCKVQTFVGVDDLQKKLRDAFPACDALVMAAAVGDFRLERVADGKLSRSAGPVTLTLIPTEDVVASVAETRRPDQQVVTFAVESGSRKEIQNKARNELIRKHADFVVLNTPGAIGAKKSEACILSSEKTLSDWAEREKTDLAKEIVALLKERRCSSHA